jgi:hypothetical protein
MGTSLSDQQLGFGEPGNIGLVNAPAAVRLSAACWVASAVVAGMMPVILEVAGIDFGQSVPAWAVPYLVAFAVPLTALQVLAAQHLLTARAGPAFFSVSPRPCRRSGHPST